MAIKDLALIKLVSDTLKKGKEKVIAVLKPKESASEYESVMDTFKSVVDKKDVDKVDVESISETQSVKSTVVKEEPEITTTSKSTKNVESKKVTEKKVVKESTKRKPVKKEIKKVAVEKPAESKSKITKKKSESVSHVAKITKVKSTPAKKSTGGSKKEAKIALYTKDVEKHYGSVDSEFLAIIVKNLGPSIYRKDAESVACTDEKELVTVRRNFLIKKLGFTNDDKDMLDGEIKKVCETMKSTKIKYRATFYYILAKNLKKESVLS